MRCVWAPDHSLPIPGLLPSWGTCPYNSAKLPFTYKWKMPYYNHQQQRWEAEGTLYEPYIGCCWPADVGVSVSGQFNHHRTSLRDPECSSPISPSSTNIQSRRIALRVWHGCPGPLSTTEEGFIYLELLEPHIQPANSAWGRLNPEWVLSKPVAKQQLRLSTSAIVLHHNATQCQNTQKQTHAS